MTSKRRVEGEATAGREESGLVSRPSWTEGGEGCGQRRVWDTCKSRTEREQG